MFQGYYLKIDGVIYPTRYMVIPSYSVNNEPIIVNDYYDADFGRHISKAPAENISITFNIRQLWNDEFAEAIAPFSDRMSIEYYDAKIDDYVTDYFTYTNKLTPSNQSTVQ